MCPVSGAVLYAIIGGQKVTALNTRTWSGLQEGQGRRHKHTPAQTLPPRIITYSSMDRVVGCRGINVCLQ